MNLTTDVAVIGGGLGGVAAALAVLERGHRVVLTEEYAWLGGQLTSQAVPPDEHIWVEQFGVTARYRALRDGIRRYYRDHYPLSEEARADQTLNPGRGRVSRLCHEPRVAVAVIDQLLAPYRSNGQLVVLQPAVPVEAAVVDDVVRSVTVEHGRTGIRTVIEASFVLDATETGDLLPLTGTAYVVGAEARSETGEPSAAAVADPENVQSIAWCFVFDHVDGDHTIPRPVDYDEWKQLELPFWGAPMLSFTAPNPRTLEPEERTLDVNPALDRSGDPRVDSRRHRSVAVPSDRCAADLPRGLRPERHRAGELAAARLRRRVHHRQRRPRVTPRRGQGPVARLLPLAADRGAAPRRRIRLARAPTAR